VEKHVYDGQTVVCGKDVSGMGIPYYQEQINEFLRNFTELFNDIEKQGVDLDNNPMGAFFVAENDTGTTYEFNDGTEGVTISSSSDTYYQLTAANAAVNATSLKNPRYFATTDDVINGSDNAKLAEELMKLHDSVTVFRGDGASSFLETLMSDITVDTQKAEIFQQNYSNLEASISTQRMSVSGVDEDEEALNLVKYQNAYNLASKVISVMSEMYDKLINETGVT
jgi:flagellar hook-associated protein 1 FlgK